MTATKWSGAFAAAVLATVLAGGSAAAETYTNQFRGEGDSSFGFAWLYARAQAENRAGDDGFTDPSNQCREVFAFGNVYSAEVVWECTR